MLESRADLLPLLSLLIGMATVIGMILLLKMNAFISLITAALVVSLLAPGEAAAKVSRVATAFGGAAGNIGVVIAMAAIIGKCMMASGAADRIVRSMMRLFGENRAPAALTFSGYVLSIPVFYDTVFYLLIPLARSLYLRTRAHYLKYVLALSMGALATHSLVPPTPGPLIMADNLAIDLGTLILVGAVIALPASLAGLWLAGRMDKRFPIPMRPLTGEPEPRALPERELPSAFWSHIPIVLPVVLIGSHTVVARLEAGGGADVWTSLSPYTAIFGNANLALMLSAAVALFVLWRRRRLTRYELSRTVEISLMSGGIIILITAAGGAFGAMLREVGVGDAIGRAFAGSAATGIAVLFVAFVVASVVKLAQGSGTVSMITASGMLAAMLDTPSATAALGYHPVYLATAIGSGSMVGSWMNDSGFWIYAKMGGFTEAESLKTWTLAAAAMGVVGMVMTLILSQLIPLT